MTDIELQKIAAMVIAGMKETPAPGAPPRSAPNAGGVDMDEITPTNMSDPVKAQRVAAAIAAVLRADGTIKT